VLAAAALLILTVMAGIEALRHTDASPDGVVEIDGGDPRAAIECPGEPPVEGARPEPAVEPAERPEVEVTSGLLLDCPNAFDGRRVRYRGEVVGQRLGRGEHRWIQVNDDAYATDHGPLPAHRRYLGGNSGLGVRIGADDDAGVRWRGGPGVAGDRVEVRGTFHRVDPDRGEMAVILAESLDVLAPGRSTASAPLRARQGVAYALTALTGLLLLLGRGRSRS
jgi:hypothetical protein